MSEFDQAKLYRLIRSADSRDFDISEAADVIGTLPRSMQVALVGELLLSIIYRLEYTPDVIGALIVLKNLETSGFIDQVLSPNI